MLATALGKLNNRPLKCLNYQTPNEVFLKKYRWCLVVPSSQRIVERTNIITNLSFIEWPSVFGGEKMTIPLTKER